MNEIDKYIKEMEELKKKGKKKCHFCEEYYPEENIKEVIYWSGIGRKLTNNMCKKCRKKWRNFRCKDCNCYIPNAYDRYCGCDDELYCSDCFHEIFTRCERCGDTEYRDDTYNHHGFYYCESCYEEVEAEEERNHDKGYFDRNKAIIKRSEKNNYKTGELIGLEIEAIMRNFDFCKDDYDCLNYFMSVEDGSLNGDGREFVSCVLPYKRKYLNIVKDFCEKFGKQNLMIDSSCGFHCHININKDDINLSFIKKLLYFYIKYEEFFYNLVSCSRWDNEFCRHMRYELKLPEVIRKKSLNNLLSYYYDRVIKNRRDIPNNKWDGKGKRYYWVNIHSVMFRGSLEIRLHQGTVNYKKMLMWIKIHRKIVKFLLKTRLDKLRKMKLSEILTKAFSKTEIKYMKDRFKKFNHNFKRTVLTFDEFKIPKKKKETPKPKNYYWDAISERIRVSRTDG